MIAIGDRAPELSLPDTDGREHPLVPGGEVTAVIFTCNHCPYALAWHERIADAARDHPDVRFRAVNPNDAERYPADSLEAMRERVAAEDWPMPYLHDESQEAARRLGAQTTPDVFVFGADGRLAYRGAPDADHRDPEQGASWLRGALAALSAGRRPEPAETEPVGCSVKWRP